MQASGWIQLIFYVVALVLITKPMGLYLVHVLDANGQTWFDRILKPLERLTYRLMGVDAGREHDWQQYTLAMLLFSMVSLVFNYATELRAVPHARANRRTLPDRSGKTFLIRVSEATSSTCRGPSPTHPLAKGRCRH